MVPELFRIDELPWDLLVNGIRVRSVLIRYAPDSVDFQIGIDDPIGSIILHDGFKLEMKEQDSWRPLTLEQLKKSLAARSDFLHAGDMPKSSEIFERRLFDRLDDVDIPHRRSPRLGKLTGHDECVREVQRVLIEARVPHQVAGTVFVVPNAFRTRFCLIRAGFRKSSISPAALIEPRTGCAVQLVERRF